MDLRVAGTSFLSFSPRREANFQHFDCLLLWWYFDWFLHYFSIDFPRIFLKNHFKMMLKKTTKNDKILNRFLNDFLSIWASILEAIFLKNRFHEGERVRGSPSFFHLRFLSPFWGTPGTDFLDFGPILPPIWKDFSSILAQFSDEFATYQHKFIYTSIHLHIHLYIYTSIHLWIYTYIYIYIYIYTYTSLYMYLDIL